MLQLLVLFADPLMKNPSEAHEGVSYQKEINNLRENIKNHNAQISFKVEILTENIVSNLNNLVPEVLHYIGHGVIIKNKTNIVSEYDNGLL